MPKTTRTEQNTAAPVIEKPAAKPAIERPAKKNASPRTPRGNQPVDNPEAKPAPQPADTTENKPDSNRSEMAQPARIQEDMNYEMAAATLADNELEAPIFIIRNQKVMLEHDVARLYEVETRTLVRAVRRNMEHFPVDFLFKLTHEEFEALLSRLPEQHERNRSTPYVFTESGVAMVSQVLNSARALQVNVAVTRDFVRLRKLCGSNLQMADKLDAMDAKYDDRFKKLFTALETLQGQVRSSERRVGFYVN